MYINGNSKKIVIFEEIFNIFILEVEIFKNLQIFYNDFCAIFMIKVYNFENL